MVTGKIQLFQSLDRILQTVYSKRVLWYIQSKVTDTILEKHYS